MKPVYCVLNVSKTVLDEDDGVKFGAAATGMLTEGAAYSGLFFTDKAAAEKKADEFARGGTGAVLFVAYEARMIKPVPVKVITLDLSGS